ncbi:hypothetical protein BZG36_00143 [Bifiguratus adelaidae]|uniref:Kinesin motor domain-containing protein n=1 Tax=Bifiguratus adelaidae TaxID=1938954 RepID=A0A261Y871_9FUNG|nr:hypothetical protein BZG36_00143 [Bifiguratus adelaidae]
MDEGRIKVVIRLRPLNSREKAGGQLNVWRTTEDSIHLVSDSGRAVAGTAYTFDRVFNGADTGTIYDYVGKDIVESATRGVNGTIFAYGQTSSGKTFTMHGSHNTPGIIQLAIRDVFKLIEETTDREFLIQVSYLEIYNEVIRDLLNPENDNLRINEDPKRGVYVGKCTAEAVSNEQRILQLLSVGEKNRRVGETNMNERSSRSHTIFRMHIESRQAKSQQSSEQSPDDASYWTSTLNLVDLAGSERASQSGAEGIRLKEGAHINKSLLALGTVIAKLAENGSENLRGHIPYRDSKMTRILQPSLGGNARTAIICTTTPSSRHADETISTLKFANRAKNIQNKPQVNEEKDGDTSVLSQYRREIDILKQQLQEMSQAPVETDHSSPSDSADLLERLRTQDEEQERLRSMYDKLKSHILTASSPPVDYISKEERRKTWFAGYSNDLNIKSRPRLDEFETESSEVGDMDARTKKRRLVSEDAPLKSLKFDHDILRQQVQAFQRKRESLKVSLQKLCDWDGIDPLDDLPEDLLPLKGHLETMKHALERVHATMTLNAERFAADQSFAIAEKDSLKMELDKVASKHGLLEQAIDMKYRELLEDAHEPNPMDPHQKLDAMSKQASQLSALATSRDAEIAQYLKERNEQSQLALKQVDVILQRFPGQYNYLNLLAKSVQEYTVLERETAKNDHLMAEMVIKCAALTQRLSVKNKKMSNFKKHLTVLRIEHANMKATLQEELQTTKLQVKTIENISAQREKELQDLKADQVTNKGALCSLEEEVKALRSQLSSSTETAISKEQRLATLEEQLKESQARQNDHHKLLEQYEAQIDANNNKIEQFKEKERALEARLADLNEENNREKAFSDSRNAELRALEAIKTELDELKASYEQLQAELAQSQSIVRTSTQSITEYQNKIVILETENESLMHALASERQAVGQQDASVQHLKAENIRLSTNLANADQNFELFACQFLELRQGCDRTFQELGASNERCAEMTNRMNAKEEAFQRLQAEFAMLQEQQGDLEILKEEQAKNIKRLSEQLEQLQAALDQSQASFQHLREERDQWLSKGEESNAKLIIKENETIALQETVAHLEQALENSSATTQSKMRELQKEVDALQLQQKSLIELISKKEGELAPLQSRLSQAITEICTLKDLNGELKATKATNLDTIQTLERRIQKEQAVRADLEARAEKLNNELKAARAEREESQKVWEARLSDARATVANHRKGTPGLERQESSLAKNEARHRLSSPMATPYRPNELSSIARLHSQLDKFRETLRSESSSIYSNPIEGTSLLMRASEQLDAGGSLSSSANESEHEKNPATQMDAQNEYDRTTQAEAECKRLQAELESIKKENHRLRERQKRARERGLKRLTNKENEAASQAEHEEKSPAAKKDDKVETSEFKMNSILQDTQLGERRLMAKTFNFGSRPFSLRN